MSNDHLEQGKRLLKKFVIVDNDNTMYLNRELALQKFSQALNEKTSDTEKAEIYSLMGQCVFENERYNDAIEYYSKVIKFTPEYINAYSKRGLAKYHQQDYDGAIADFTKEIELNFKYDKSREDNYTPYLNRGNAKCKKKIIMVQL